MEATLMIRECILICICLGGYCHSFLLQNDCQLDSNPCNISDNVLQCSNTQLQDVPRIKANVSHIFFNYNNFTSLEDNAFKCLTNASRYTYMYLNNNKLRNIANGSFNGIGHTIFLLDLSNNFLESLPSALGQLSSLDVLNLEGNYIAKLDALAMVNIGHTLSVLVIGFGNLAFWPTEFEYLRILHRLTLINVPLKLLPDDAFHGFEHSLMYLNITSTRLQKIPSAICHLKNLDSLFIFKNSYLEESISPVIQPCFGNKTQIRDLTVNENNIKQYPNIYDMFSYSTIRKIDFGRNQINVMNSNSLRNDSLTGILYLDNNKFVRIPSAVNLYTQLSTLDIKSNLIQSVEDYDLFKLEQLHGLNLQHNPIEYITNGAFNNNRQLHYLILSDTMLIHIPSALKQLPSLVSLGLDGLHIKCTCDMVYLSTWDVSNIYFSQNSTCFLSNEGIKDYIINSLPICVKH